MQFHKILAGTILAAVCTYASAQTLYPENGAKNVAYDSQLVINFDVEPELTPTASVYIYDSTGNLVDSIKFADETQVFADGSNVAVGAQLVRKEGKSVYITPHNYKLAPASSYYVILDNGAIKAGDFSGFAAGAWEFSTKAEPSIASNTITINNSTNKDNNADFHSIQAALDYVKDKEGTYTLSLAPSKYYELLHYNGKANIVLQGPKDNNRGDNCVIEYINCNDLNGSQNTRVSFFFIGADLTLENVTLINSADGEKVYSSATKYASGNAQAETIFFKSGKGHKLVAYNSSFKGHQDTMQISGKCWFYNCYIEGDVDYIWGTADVALFEECDLYCLRYVKDRAYLFETRVGSTENPLVPKGFVLFNSTVTVAKNQTAFYGRRATAVEKAKSPYYDQCAIVNVNFVGEGNFGDMRWYVGKPPRVTKEPAHIGWKEYNVNLKELQGRKPSDTAKRYKDAADISKKVYKKEYSNRDLIMNRVYNTDKSAYEADTQTPWDINQLARDRGYNVKNLPKQKK